MYKLFGVCIHVSFWLLKFDLHKNMQAHYFWPLDSIGVKEFEKIWCEVTNKLGGQITTDTIPVMFGRYLFIIYYWFNKFILSRSKTFMFFRSENWRFLKAVREWQGSHSTISVVSRYHTCLCISLILFLILS